MNMEITIIPDTQDVVKVTLSRRNLVTLLNKLDDPESHKTLYRHTAPGETLIVVAEEDATHYAKREAGCVHPDHEPPIRFDDPYTPAPDPQDYHDPLDYQLAVSQWEEEGGA